MIDQVIGYLRQYPEIIAIVLGTVASWCAGLLVDYFVPEGTPARSEKQLTIVVNLVVCTLVSFEVWRVLDPKDPRELDLVVSMACALISPFSYVWVSKAIEHFFPWFGSVWGGRSSAPSGP